MKNIIFLSLLGMDKVILEIRAGVGGDEAAIFAADLLRMYQRFSTNKNWQFTIIDFNQTSLSGYKSVVAEIANSKNPNEKIYGLLKNEIGVHRIQRIPKTEKAGRVHTSTASVAILPEVEQKEIQINPNDLELSFFRSSGPGGQNVNKVETGVRIIHKPTGTVVASQAGRSQHANRETAMGILRSRIYENIRIEEEIKLGKLRRDQIGLGERSEKIRTYNFPDDRVTDHRIGKKFHNIEKILEGNLEPIIKAFQKNNA